jgi:hypothetical protein
LKLNHSANLKTSQGDWGHTATVSGWEVVNGREKVRHGPGDKFKKQGAWAVEVVSGPVLCDEE